MFFSDVTDTQSHRPVERGKWNMVTETSGYVQTNILTEVKNAVDNNILDIFTCLYVVIGGLPTEKCPIGPR